jgi:putative addiction module component (TIGR02574 family)
MSDNQNQIITTDWSNPASSRLQAQNWPDEPKCQEQCFNGHQCGGCSFFAPFNCDWGLCTHQESRHHLETVYEHFTCPSYVMECWGPHSFTVDEEFHCRCGGGLDFSGCSKEDRVKLLENLWFSLYSIAETLPLTDEQKRELNRRMDELDTNPQNVSTWEQIKEWILKQS